MAWDEAEGEMEIREWCFEYRMRNIRFDGMCDREGMRNVTAVGKAWKGGERQTCKKTSENYRGNERLEKSGSPVKAAPSLF